MIGLQILKRNRCVSPRQITAFLGLPVANISDCMARMSAGGPRLRPMHRGAPMAGAALTVRCRPGDNLMIHKALQMAGPGDVIVVDAGGELTNALIGEIMVTIATRRGIAGIVINGAIRDSEAIAAGDFPVYAAGITHRGPYKDGPGEINVPIGIDGMLITPGDLIVGDADGLLCVPFEAVDALLAATLAKMDAEKTMLREIAEDRLDVRWIDETLRRIGCDPEPR